MNTTELTDRLRAATDGLAVPPDFAQVVLRGGRRRRARRRLAVAVSVAAVVAVGSAATVVTLRDDPPAPVADARLTMPTQGDLAGDQAFLAEARRAWADGLPSAPEARDRYYDDPRGEPHVYWAGHTPAGRAAIVLQQVFVHPNSQVTEKGLRTAEGLVATDPGDGRFKLVGTRVIGIDVPGQATYFKFGPDDRTVLAVDHGEPLHYGRSPAYREEDKVLEFDWERADPDGGVAVTTVPETANPQALIVYEGADPPEELAVDDLPVYPTVASTWLALRLPDPSHRLDSPVLAWGRVVWRVGAPLGMTDDELDGLWGYHRFYSLGHDTVVSLWTIAAGLPDGRVVVLKERQDGTARPRMIAEVVANQATEETVMVDGGPVDRSAILPVRFHVPGGGGWIVADKGKRLSYRTGPDAPWRDAGEDAALLPENTTEVLAGDHYVRF